MTPGISEVTIGNPFLYNFQKVKRLGSYTSDQNDEFLPNFGIVLPKMFIFQKIIDYNDIY